MSCRRAGFLSFAVQSLERSRVWLRALPRRPSIEEVGGLVERRVEAEGMGLEGLRSEREVGVSGLVSPSTSTESGSEGYEAFVEGGQVLMER